MTSRPKKTRKSRSDPNYARADAAARAFGRATFAAPAAGRFTVAGLASPAIFASLANAAGSVTARSAGVFRSIGLPAAVGPAISWPYVRPCSRAAALIRMTHSRRKSRFLRRRPTNAYLSAVSTDSFADRYSLLFV